MRTPPLRRVERAHLASLLSGIFLFTGDAIGQGCSDAGVCTAGPIGELTLQGDSTAQPPRHFARLTVSLAAGEQGTSIVQVTPEVSIGATERLAFQVKIPYVRVSGNLGGTSGMGDPVLTATYAFIAREDEHLDALAGAKVNAGNAGRSVDGRPLPMPYQTSLGTTDLLLGVNYRWKGITVAAAYQHVLAQNNRNGFARSAWAGSTDSSAAAGYFESTVLERASDAVARVQYAFRFGKFGVQPGLLGIMHLGEDTRLSTDTVPQRVAIQGSDGLTLNLTVDALYRPGRAWAIEAAFGTPLVTRKARPDGLTRSMVLNLGVRYEF